MRAYNKSGKKGKRNKYMGYSIMITPPLEKERVPAKVNFKGRDYRKFVLVKYFSKIMSGEARLTFTK